MPLEDSPSFAEEGSQAPPLLALEPWKVICQLLPVQGMSTAAAALACASAPHPAASGTHARPSSG